jgi:hypothetical protein
MDGCFHHVVWADNEVVIPHGVFVHDLVKPSIEEEEKLVAEQPSTDQLIAMIGENHSLGISPLQRFPRIRPRWNASYGIASIMCWSRGSLCARRRRKNCCKNACPRNTEGRFWKRSMLALVATMPLHAHWSARLFE